MVVGFRYTGLLELFPSPNIAAAETEPFSVFISNPAILFLSGPSVLSAVEAELMNLGRRFIMRDVWSEIQKRIARRVNASVI